MSSVVAGGCMTGSGVRTASTGLAGVGARIWPFCLASKGGWFGLPPPPDSASSTRREGTTRTDGSECGRSDTKNAEPSTSRSRRKRCIPAEVNRHFFSSHFILSRRRLGPQRNLVDTRPFQPVQDRGHILVKAVFIRPNIDQQLGIAAMLEHELIRNLLQAHAPSADHLL